MDEQNKAALILKNAKEDLAAGKISRREFNSLMMTFGAVAGYTLFNSFAHAWTGTRMRKGSGVTGYQISRSLRFRSSASAYLSRTLTTPTNNKKFTWSGWFKVGSLSAYQIIFSASFNSLNGLNYFSYNSQGQLFLYYEGGGMKTGWVTTPLFRDPSAWYHIVLSVDTTQASYTTMVNIYVNGVAQTLTYNNYSSSYITQNTNMWINSAMAHNIGRDAIQGYYAESTLAEIYFVDGQTLTAGSFAQTDTTTGAWTPKKYIGTYGTNGFYLPLSDTSSTTNLVKDSSGNNNHWTANNISLTAGVTYDSMTDVPLSYGTTNRGNYCVLNPLGGSAYVGYPINGNLQTSTGGNSGGNYNSLGTIAAKSKIYFETTIFNCNLSTGSTAGAVGYVDSSTFLGANVLPGGQANSFSFIPGGGTTAWVSKKNTAQATLSLTGIANGDVIGVAYDPINGNAWVSKNGVWNGSGNPSTGANPDLTGVASTNYIPVVTPYYDGTYVINHDCNFGQRAFAYTLPTGFTGLHTGILPTPAIIKPNQYFDVLTRTGTGASYNVTGRAFKPDFVWSKSRSNAQNNELYDSVRGATKYILSDTTNAEGTVAQGLTTFNSDGYTLGNSTGSAMNISGQSIVDWMWKAGGAAVTDNSGTLTSQVSANTTSGFSIVSYSLPASGTVTIGHGLGAIPKMIITKKRDTAENWCVWFSGFTVSEYLYFNSTAAKASTTSPWGAATPTSTVFGTTVGQLTSGSPNNQIAYCFAEIDGFSRFGSYTGNGGTGGPNIFCGFRPRFVMIKSSVGTIGDWEIHDTSRDTNNLAVNRIWANSSNAETSNANYIDILSNGFKLRNADSNSNASGVTYLYATFAEAPFKYANAR